MNAPPFVKVQGGATYTIIERLPASDPPVYYWLGDNGAELEITEEEASQYGLN